MLTNSRTGKKYFGYMKNVNSNFQKQTHIESNGWFVNKDDLLSMQNMISKNNNNMKREND